MTATPIDEARIEAVLECTDLDAMVAFATGELGMRVDSISPADSPATIVLSGSGLALRLRRGDRDVAGDFVVRVPGRAEPRVLIAPNGTRFHFVADGGSVEVPDNAPSFSLVRARDRFGVGRAGMEYRDLLPDRWGGRFIASHIRIPGGGAVADSVHFHRIRFQMIFCAAGWVDLVYEDQGDPFRLEAGDCVVQPPEIRHRVLRASPGLEVIEIGCPAVHDTLIDHDLGLPTAVLDPGRDFGGQQFVRDVAARATWVPWLVDGLRVRHTGIAGATGGLAGAVVVGATPGAAVAARSAPSMMLHHHAEFVFDVVLSGSAHLHLDDPTAGRVERIGSRDAVAFPPGLRWGWSAWSSDFALLEVSLPPDAVTRGNRPAS